MQQREREREREGERERQRQRQRQRDRVFSHIPAPNRHDETPPSLASRVERRCRPGKIAVVSCVCQCRHPSRVKSWNPPTTGRPWRICGWESTTAAAPTCRCEGDRSSWPLDYPHCPPPALFHPQGAYVNLPLPPLQVMVSYSWIVDSLLDMLTQSIEPVRRTAVGPSVATLLLVQRIKVG